MEQIYSMLGISAEVEAFGNAVLKDLKERDERDSKRATAPLKPAEDAFILDTSRLYGFCRFSEIPRVATN